MKSQVKTLRISADNLAKIEKQMKTHQLNFSDYALYSMLQIKKPRKQNPINRALLCELARAGNNLNQCAKRANTNKSFDLVALEMLSKIETHLREIREHFC